MENVLKAEQVTYGYTDADFVNNLSLEFNNSRSIK